MSISIPIFADVAHVTQPDFPGGVARGESFAALACAEAGYRCTVRSELTGTYERKAVSG